MVNLTIVRRLAIPFASAFAISLASASAVNAESLFKHPKKWYASVERSAKKDVKNLGERIEREGENFFRWVRESECDREDRKRGEEAKKACEAKGSGTGNPQYSGYGTFYAALEVDCWKPGHATRWSTVTVSFMSIISQDHAVRSVLDDVASRNVCTMSSDFTLREGQSRWVHN